MANLKGLTVPDETEKKSPQKQTGQKAELTADSALIQSEIGQKLKTLYDGVVEQEVPDRFLDLLDKLGKSETQAK